MERECDIVLLSYENPDLLKKCVQSILDHTNLKCRLIIVDNASKNSEVKQYLEILHGNDNVTIEKIFNKENEGFARGMNRGMRLANASFVCLINNDCIVTDGWLHEMIKVADEKDNIGLVNPASNTFGLRPSKGTSIDEYARLFSKKSGHFVELGHAIAFACLIKRKLIEKIGYLDEAYKGVCYEDTDYSMRAQEAGFISVMALASYVFHFEQASRRSLENKESIYRANRELCDSRWGRLLRIFFFDREASTNMLFLQEYETLKKIARKRAIVEMWAQGNIRFNLENITRHADVWSKGLPRHFRDLGIIWRILTKKKRFDAIILRSGFLLDFLRLLKPLHKSEVFRLEDTSRIILKNGNEFNLDEPSSLVVDIRESKANK